MNLFGMTPDQVAMAAERYYDRMLDAYERSMARDEPWERDNPQWGEIADLVDVQSWEWICDTVRDFMEGDGDLLMEIHDAGLLAQYERPERLRMDADTCWDEICRAMDAHLSDNDLIKEIYKWLPEKHLQRMCEALRKAADTNGIRDLYNKAHEEDD